MFHIVTVIWIVLVVFWFISLLYIIYHDLYNLIKDYYRERGHKFYRTTQNFITTVESKRRNSFVPPGPSDKPIFYSDK